MTSTSSGKLESEMTSYKEAVQTLNTLQSNAETRATIASTGDSRRHHNIPSMIKYLKRCGVVLEDLKKLSVIHISGTKGKGSTSAFCESILHRHGYKTGMFSSPHLVTVNERFRLNEKPVAKDLFSKYFWDVYNKLDSTKDMNPDPDVKPMPGYFSFLTVMAFNMFLKENVDVVVLEVGIGGEYDSTNVVQTPVVCGVTSLGLDHITILGETIDKIAWHKAGIFKPNVPAVTVQQPEDAMNVLLSRAKEKGATLYSAPPLDSYDSGGDSLQLGIAGSVQKHNATLALQLSRIWLHNHDKELMKRSWVGENSNKIPVLDPFELSEKMKSGLSTCYWPGRNHILHRSGVTYYMDGAHTLESVQQCMEWFQQESAKEAAQHKGRTVKVLMFNATKDRNSEALLSILKPLSFDASVFCPNLAFTGTIANTPDQTNRGVTKEKQLNFSQTNKEIWDRITSTSDTPQSPPSQNAQSCHQSSPDFIQIDKSHAQPSSHAFPCVLQALYWASLGRDQVLEVTEDADIPLIPDFLRKSCHVQILITGSLHLVGANLSLLKSELW